MWTPFLSSLVSVSDIPTEEVSTNNFLFSRDSPELSPLPGSYPASLWCKSAYVALLSGILLFPYYLWVEF